MPQQGAPALEHVGCWCWYLLLLLTAIPCGAQGIPWMSFVETVATISCSSLGVAREFPYKLKETPFGWVVVVVSAVLH